MYIGTTFTWKKSDKLLELVFLSRIICASTSIDTRDFWRRRRFWSLLSSFGFCIFWIQRRTRWRLIWNRCNCAYVFAFTNYLDFTIVRCVFLYYTCLCASSLQPPIKSRSFSYQKMTNDTWAVKNFSDNPLILNTLIYHLKMR